MSKRSLIAIAGALLVMGMASYFPMRPAFSYIWESPNFKDKYETITFFTNDRFKNPAMRTQFLTWIEAKQIAVENESDYNTTVIEFLLYKIADLEAKIQSGSTVRSPSNLKFTPIAPGTVTH